MRVACAAGGMLSLATAGVAGAQDAGMPLFEVTPFVAWRTAGDFEVEGLEGDVDLDDHNSFALALNLRIDEYSQYELFYSRQRTSLQDTAVVGPLDVEVEYWHLGGTLAIEGDYRVQPYIVGTLGITHFSPGLPGADDDSRFSLSLGGGLRVPLRKHFSLRLEARGYLTFMDSDSAIFCASGEQGGVCAIRASTSTFFQFEVLAGAAFAF